MENLRVGLAVASIIAVMAIFAAIVMMSGRLVFVA
ncbi:Uncharacterised protein [uncultured archaeon]|nr:Uncharacterised protein [uncultured archaeon]